MELFGYLSFVGDLQEITTQNTQFSNEPFIVREVCVHSFVPGSHDGQLVPYLRGTTLRLTGRSAQVFNIAQGGLVTVEYSTSARPYLDKEKNQLRANGNLTISRIVEVTQTDLESINKLMQSYSQLKQ